jgi:hypothetical protein
MLATRQEVTMTIDRYTKTILTVIALCLIYLCLGRPGIAVPVAAQSGYQRVVVAGWVDKTGKELRLPAPLDSGTTIAPLPAAEPRYGYPSK